MYEEYVREDKIKDKTDEEKRLEINNEHYKNQARST